MTASAQSPHLTGPDPTAMTLERYAFAALAADIAVLPAKEDGTKMPIDEGWVGDDGKPVIDPAKGRQGYGWKHRQTVRAKSDDIRRWYGSGRRAGFGIVCGAVSGKLQPLPEGVIGPPAILGLEMVEFEDRDRWDAFVELAHQIGHGGLIDRIAAGYLSATPGGGVHTLIRCSEFAGNLKLAFRPATEAELAVKPDEDRKVVAETRGQGGFTVEPPSHGAVHPTGRPYRLLQGGLSTIVTVTPEVRQIILNLIRTFDELPDDPPAPFHEEVSRRETIDDQIRLEPAWNYDGPTALDVIAAYNARTTWDELLTRHGWRRMGTSPAGVGFWARPGKTDPGSSATTNYGGSDRLCVFSTTPKLKATSSGGSKAAYDRFGFYAETEHGGDNKEAVKAASALLGMNGRGPDFVFDETMFFSPSGNGYANAQARGSAPASEGAQSNVAPLTLDQVTAMFKKWLYLQDVGPVLVILATIAANRMQGDPLWLMIVGASSGGKTEILNAATHLAHVHLAAVLTEAALLSGTSKKEAAKGAKGGLLREIGPFGVLMLKDFTSTLSMKHEARAALLAALREIYDGSWTRHVGTDGGRTLHWQGKLGLIACCTTIVDTHHAVMAAMGERFLLYRLPEINPKDQAKQALRNAGREREMRGELAAAVDGLFAGIELPERQPELSHDEADRLVSLASLSARARSAVERDGRSREIELIPDPEAPARLVQALRRLYGGLIVIGVSEAEAWPIVFKVGLDCMPKLRRSIFEYLVQHSGWITTTQIATAVEYPTQTARRSLEDLMVHGLVLRTAGGKGKSDSWTLAERARQWHAEALGSVPENSPGAYTSSSPDDPGTINDSAECTQEEFSGTPSDRGEEWRHCWSCGGDLLEETDGQCSDCGWIACSCGACGCREESAS